MLFFLLRSIIFLILFICLNYNFVNGVKTGSIINIETISAEEILNSIINSTYDRRVRPPNIDSTGKNQPVKVEVNVYLRSMWNIDFVRMEYSMQLTFRETWKDARLAYSNDSKNVPEFIVITQDNLIWMPDTFFGNEKQAYRHVIDKPNMLIRIYSDGNVLYSERITLVLSCPMFMLKYPMDEQKCDMNIASYAYTTDDILYSWRVEEAIQFHPLLNNSLPCFQLESVDLADCTSSTNTGEYSCIKTIFHLKRQASYFLVHVFMPSTTLVIVSWVSFWMDRSAVPARVTLGVTTLLTIFTQAASINNSLPVVSYIKSIDIWLGACVLFVFLAVIEFAYVSFIGTQLEERKKKCDTHAETNENIQSPSSLQEGSIKWKNKEEHELLSNEEKGVKSFGLWERYIGDADEAKQIDIKSRIIFPILFLIFNIFYWIWHFSL